MIDRKQVAIDFVKSLNHLEIKKIILYGSVVYFFELGENVKIAKFIKLYKYTHFIKI